MSRYQRGAGNEIIAWNKRGNNFMPPRASSTLAALSRFAHVAQRFIFRRNMQCSARARVAVVQPALDAIGIARWHNARRRRRRCGQLRARGPCIIIVVIVAAVVIILLIVRFISGTLPLFAR